MEELWCGGEFVGSCSCMMTPEGETEHMSKLGILPKKVIAVHPPLSQLYIEQSQERSVLNRVFGSATSPNDLHYFIPAGDTQTTLRLSASMLESKVYVYIRSLNLGITISTHD